MITTNQKRIGLLFVACLLVVGVASVYAAGESPFVAINAMLTELSNRIALLEEASPSTPLDAFPPPDYDSG